MEEGGSRTFCCSLLMRLKMYSKLRGMIPRSSWVNVSESSDGPVREVVATLKQPSSCKTISVHIIMYLSW